MASSIKLHTRHAGDLSREALTRLLLDVLARCWPGPLLGRDAPGDIGLLDEGPEQILAHARADGHIGVRYEDGLRASVTRQGETAAVDLKVRCQDGETLRAVVAIFRQLVAAGARTGAVERQLTAGFLPGPPCTAVTMHAALLDPAEVEAAYQRPADFWAGWDQVEAVGDLRLVTRSLHRIDDLDYLRAEMPRIMAMVRAARPKRCVYYAIAVDSEHRPVFDEGAPHLVQSYDEAQSEAVFTCSLPPGEHLHARELLQLRLLLERQKMLKDRRPVISVRVHFVDRATADEEKRPLLDRGMRVTFSDGDRIVEIVETEEGSRERDPAAHDAGALATRIGLPEELYLNSSHLGSSMLEVTRLVLDVMARCWQGALLGRETTAHSGEILRESPEQILAQIHPQRGLVLRWDGDVSALIAAPDRHDPRDPCRLHLKVASKERRQGVDTLHTLLAILRGLAAAGAHDGNVGRAPSAELLLSPPCTHNSAYACLVDPAAVEAEYERPAAFWAGWDQIEPVGDLRLVTRSLHRIDGRDFLRAELPRILAMVRAAQPHRAGYSYHGARPEYQEVFLEGAPHLEQSYDEARTEAVFTCTLPPGEHLHAHEIWRLRLLRDQTRKLADGRRVTSVRIHFADRATAEEEKRPLLDCGMRVTYSQGRRVAELVGPPPPRGPYD